MKAKFRIRKGDEVIVTTGKSRGMTGKVESLDTQASRVFISGVNLYKKHQKPSANNPNGGIVEKPMSIHVSNVAFLDPKTKKATRLGFQIVDGVKNRVAKRSGSVV